MTDKKILLKDANEQQLRTFGEKTLGLEFAASDKLAAIRAKIQAAYNKEEITVADDGTAPPVAAKPKANKATASKGPVLQSKTANKDEDLVRVMISRTDTPGGADPVPLGCNGKIMLVPRGEIVDIPRRYFESLKNAVRHVYDSLEGGGINPVPRPVQEYPYQTYEAA